MVDVDPQRVRELARSTRTHASAVGAQKPLANGVNAAADAQDCEVARNLRDTAAALDTVLQYHVTRLNHFAALARQGADRYEAADERNGQRFGN
ncbi:hypothetical protein GCM10009624_11340 [Gordonia sinesedis]